MENTKVLPNHIEEYFKNKESKEDFVNLFESKKDDFDLKSEYSKEEIIYINIGILNSKMAISCGFDEDNIYNQFIIGFSRARFSMDRQSRKEFVLINKKDKFEENLNTFNSLQNLKKVKE